VPELCLAVARPPSHCPSRSPDLDELAQDPARRAELAGAGYDRFVADFAEAKVTAAYRDLLERVAA